MEFLKSYDCGETVHRTYDTYCPKVAKNPQMQDVEGGNHRDCRAFRLGPPRATEGRNHASGYPRSDVASRDRNSASSSKPASTS